MNIQIPVSIDKKAFKIAIGLKSLTGHKFACTVSVYNSNKDKIEHHSIPSTATFKNPTVFLETSPNIMQSGSEIHVSYTSGMSATSNSNYNLQVSLWVDGSVVTPPNSLSGNKVGENGFIAYLIT